MRLDDLNPVASSDFLITIEGLQHYFTTFSGVKKNFSRPKFSDGLTNQMRSASTGSKEYEEITISKPHDPSKDDDLITFLEQHEDGTPFVCTVRAVKRSKELEFRSNKSIRLSGCKLASYSYPGDVDTGKGDEVAKIEISFSIENAEYAGIKDKTTREKDITSLFGAI